MVRQRLLEQNVGQGQPSARLEQAGHLVKGLLFLGLGNKIDDAVGYDTVRNDAIESDVGDLRFHKEDVVLARACFVLVGPGKHVLQNNGAFY